jgi:cytosine permease
MSQDALPATVPGYRIALIILGIAMSPVLLAGSALGSRLPPGAALRAICTGSAILTLIACLTGWVGVSARMNTYRIVRFPFGTAGSRAINLLFALSLFGWTCVTASCFGAALRDLLLLDGRVAPQWLLVGLGCFVCVGITAFGFGFLDRVTRIAIPLLMALLGWLMWRFLALPGLPAHVVPARLDAGVAVSSVVGTFMILVTTMPDFSSLVHGRREALIGAVLALGIAYPLLFAAGALPCSLSARTSLAGAMALCAATLPTGLMLLLATVTGNAGNLFQGVLATATFLPRWPRARVTLLLGALAWGIGSQDILAGFIPFLLFLGIAVPPVAGIYLTDYYFNRRGGYDEASLTRQPAVVWPSFAIWAVATLVGGLAAQHWLTFSAIPSLDALVTASVLYAGYSRLSLHRTGPRHLRQ